jgi:hypothetical protein
LVAELRACADDAARVERLQTWQTQPPPRGVPRPARRERTAAQWLMADVASLTRVSARLQARLGEPLSVLGPRAAQVATHALAALGPVLAALSSTIGRVTAGDGAP